MHAHLSSAELERALEDLNRRFGWDDPGARFSLVRSKKGRHSTISVLSSDRGGAVVVKDGRDEWGPIAANDVAKAMASAAATLDSSDRWAAPAPVAWMESPKLVVTRYVDGIDLTEVLRDSEHPLWNEATGTLEDWLNTAGTALASYHRNAAADATSYPEAVRALAATTRRLFIGARSARWLVPDRAEGLHARSYGDPNPANWRRGHDGTVWLLDPPFDTHYAFVHRDVAQLLHRSERILKTRGQEGRFEPVREAFLAGYDSSVHPLHSARDRALLALFRARFYLGAARLESRRDWRLVGRELAMALQLRRRALILRAAP